MLTKPSSDHFLKKRVSPGPFRRIGSISKAHFLLPVAKAVNDVHPEQRMQESNCLSIVLAS